MEQRNHVWDIQITLASGPEPSWDDPLLVSPTHAGGTAGLLDLLRDFKANSDVATLMVTHATGDVFDYVITHTDARVWSQQLRRADPVLDGALTFDVPDFWTLREIQTGRGPIVRKILELLNAYDITDIEVVWL